MAARRVKFVGAFVETPSPATGAVPMVPPMMQPDEFPVMLCRGGRLPSVILTCPAQQCVAEIDSLWILSDHEWRMVR